MGIFKKITEIFNKKSEVRESIVKNIGQGRRYGNYGYSKIVQEAYKENFVVFRCLQLIINGSNKINYKIFAKKQDGSNEEIKNHPALNIFSNPNPDYSFSEFIERAALYYYIGGEAPMQLIKNTFGYALYTYRPDKMSYALSNNPIFPYTKISYSGHGYTFIPDEEFFIMKNFNPSDDLDGLGHGFPVLSSSFKVVDQHNSLKDWNINLLDEGCRLSGVLSFSQGIGEEALKRLERRFNEKYSGSRNVGKFAIIDSTAKFDEMSTNPKDADWIEGEKMTVGQICSALGIDPILIGQNEHSSYNNKSEANKALYTQTVLPFSEKLVRSLENHFRKIGILKNNEFIKLDTSDIPELQKNKKELAETLEKSNYMTLNEKRREAGLDEVDGGDIIIVNKDFVFKNGEISSIKETAITENKSINNEKKKLDFLY